jgi:predicted membrane protein
MYVDQFTFSFEVTNLIIFWIIPVIILWNKERNRMVTLIILSFILGSNGFIYYTALLIFPYFAIFRLAKPYSLWANRFYKTSKIQKAEIRYNEYSGWGRLVQGMIPIEIELEEE